MKSLWTAAIGATLGLSCLVREVSSLRADRSTAPRHDDTIANAPTASERAASSEPAARRASERAVTAPPNTASSKPASLDTPSPNTASSKPASLDTPSPNTASSKPASPGTPSPNAPPPNAPALAALADVDPDNDGVVAPPEPIADCEARLNAAGIKYEAAKLPIRQRRGGPVCGAEQAVVYQGTPNKIRYSSAPLVTCGMALALADFERIVHEEATKHLGKRVVSVSHAGTYSCRQMARFQSLVSEHSYANAIDIRSFRLENGRTISVLRDFEKTGTAASQFLHAVAQRLYDERVFSVVLTEYFDKLHRDHFHVDLARYRVDGTR